MKMTKALFASLADAIDNTLSNHSLKSMIEHRQRISYTNNQFLSFCWSIFHASKFDCNILYNAGLDDNHIETALKRILSDFA